MTYSDFSPDNPFRAVDWRWLRAGLMSAGKLPRSRKRDNDPLIAKAAKFRHRYDAAESGLEKTLLAEAEPEIFWASEVAKADKGTHIHCGLRYEIEARILAGCSDEEIAAQTAMRPEVIRTYEALHFNVRPKLESESYILQCVLGQSVQRGLSLRDYDLLWKLYGYLRGPHTLDFVIRGWTRNRYLVNKADVARQFEIDQGDEILYQAGVTSKTLRVHADNQGDVVKLYYQLRDMERSAGSSAGGAKDAIQEAIGVFISQNTYLTGAPAEDDQSKQAKLSALDIELSSADLARYERGEGLDQLTHRAAVRFPDDPQLEDQA